MPYSFLDFFKNAENTQHFVIRAVGKHSPISSFATSYVPGVFARRIAAENAEHIADVCAVHTNEQIVFGIVALLQLHRAFAVARQSMLSVSPRLRLSRY